MSEKPNKNAQIAEEKKQAISEVQGIKIPTKALALARSVGIDLAPLVEWGKTVEIRLQAQGQALETLGVKLDPLIKLAEKVSQAPPPTPSAPSMPMDMSGLIQLLPAILGGGAGGSNPLQDKMNAVLGAVLDKTLERISQPSRFEQLLDEEIAKSKAKAVAAMIT